MYTSRSIIPSSVFPSISQTSFMRCAVSRPQLIGFRFFSKEVVFLVFEKTESLLDNDKLIYPTNKNTVTLRVLY